jgi:hypothetical protein
VATLLLEVADIFRVWGESYRASHSLSRAQHRAMAAIEQCRTAALGGHLYVCDRCGREHPLYNSCRNRHCPKCQGLDRAEWLAARLDDLLPVPYFHVVFTIPEALNGLFQANPERLYALLFAAAQQTLQQLAADPKYLGARLGILAVLHTWSQTLAFHPHVHAIVTGGGLSLDGRRWIAARPGFLFPVAVVRRLFRGKLLAGLQALHADGALRLPAGAGLDDPLRFSAFLSALYGKEWVVHVKPPFAGPETVLRYLGRYTHRIAISNQRLVGLEGDEVVFRYKDRAEDERWKTMRLGAMEFIRRFLLHVLPERFVRIRYFGLLAHRHRRHLLALCRDRLGVAPVSAAVKPSIETWQERLLRLTGVDVLQCPACKTGRLQAVAVLPARSAAPIPRAPP